VKRKEQTDDRTLRALPVDLQLRNWEAQAKDPRPRLRTGWMELDSLLRRGGLAPSTLVVLAGRTGTRKTTVAANLASQFVEQDVPVGLVGLDEAPVNYTAKVCSAMFGVNDAVLEDNWDAPGTQDLLKRFYATTEGRFFTSQGQRPDFELLDAWLDECAMQGARPRVVFIDYSSLLDRNRFDGGETQRVQRLIENIHTWTKRNELVTFAIHQVGRDGDNPNSSKRYHGDTPGTNEMLMYGGEQTADIILFTYRPALNPLGKVSRELALEQYDEKQFEEWERAQRMVDRYRNSTFLQLLKNRPGTKLHEEGFELYSVGDSMKMRPASAEVDDRGERLATARE
jgi:KaiC/GvpD/RAD55 family RecA-like ATPase